MLTVPHVIVGAALGSLIGDVPGAPVLAFTVGWASHYVLDSIPHWERLYKPFDKIDWETHDPTGKWPRHIFIQAALDVIVAFVILFFLSRLAAGDGVWWQSTVFWGGLGGPLPDLLGNVPFWNRFLGRLPGFKQEYAFHAKMHISQQKHDAAPKWAGLLTQVIVVTVALWVLLSN